MSDIQWAVERRRDMQLANPGVDISVLAEKFYDSLTQAEKAALLETLLYQWFLQGNTSLRSNAPKLRSKNGSPRWDAVKRYLNTVHVLSAEGMKVLVDCTADDLLFCAADLRQTASELNANADKWTRWAAAVPPGGTVGDIPEAELAELIQ